MLVPRMYSCEIYPCTLFVTTRKGLTFAAQVPYVCLSPSSSVNGVSAVIRMIR